MGCVSKQVELAMAERLKKGLALIKSSGIEWLEIGIFGSFAREDYKATSDIDFCVKVEEIPNYKVSGRLREELELLGADLVWVTPKSFKESDSLFMRNLRRDYRAVLVKEVGVVL